MARPLRLQAAGLTYHVMARGNARMPIFIDAVDFRRFLEVLGDAAADYRLRCWAFCLMPNHYHLVIQTEEANLSCAVRQVNGVYAQWWNRRHDRVGHVTQARFKAQVVQEHAYLLAVCRYVLLNPVRAGLTVRPEAWPWSSCGATLGLAPVPRCLTPWLLLDVLGDVPVREQRRRVRRLLGEPDVLDVGQAVRRGAPVIGEPDFVDGFRGAAPGARSGVLGRDRRFLRPSLADVLEGDGGGSLGERVLRASEHQYSDAAIAMRLGLGRRAVQRLLKLTRAAR